MFIDNKYNRWYYAIIEKAKTRKNNGEYIEKHHIIPKSLGGNNTKDNLVKLLFREHFVCHLLLVKITEGKNKRKMKSAVGKFIQIAPNQERRFTSWEYERIRKNLSDSKKGIPRTKETKVKMEKTFFQIGHIPHNKGQSGVVTQTDQFKKNLADLYTGKTFENRFGKERAEEICSKISESKMGKPGGMLDKNHSEETKEKMRNPKPEGFGNRISKARKGMKFSETHLANLTEVNRINAEKRRGVKQEIMTCPHCEKSGGASLMKRYHFENCKQKIN